MADAIRHARSVSPWFIPNKGGNPSNLHGITSITGGASVASEDVFVMGKSENVLQIKIFLNLHYLLLNWKEERLLVI